MERWQRELLVEVTVHGLLLELEVRNEEGLFDIGGLLLQLIDVWDDCCRQWHRFQRHCRLTVDPIEAVRYPLNLSLLLAHLLKLLREEVLLSVAFLLTRPFVVQYPFDGVTFLIEFIFLRYGGTYILFMLRLLLGFLDLHTRLILVVKLTMVELLEVVQLLLRVFFLVVLEERFLLCIDFWLH